MRRGREMHAAMRVIVITRSRHLLAALSSGGMCVRWQPEWTLSQKVVRLAQVRGCSEFHRKFFDTSPVPVCVCCFQTGRTAHIWILCYEFSLSFFRRLGCSFGHCYSPTIVSFFFFYWTQFEKAPSVMVIICELRGTHILTLTQWHYSWDGMVRAVRQTSAQT